jgi:hypothetical protein
MDRVELMQTLQEHFDQLVQVDLRKEFSILNQVVQAASPNKFLSNASKPLRKVVNQSALKLYAYRFHIGRCRLWLQITAPLLVLLGLPPKCFMF